jgi:hypothetical protein
VFWVPDKTSFDIMLLTSAHRLTDVFFTVTQSSLHPSISIHRLFAMSSPASLARSLQLAYVGLGNIGLPVARNLATYPQQAKLKVWNRTKDKYNLILEAAKQKAFIRPPISLPIRKMRV